MAGMDLTSIDPHLKTLYPKGVQWEILKESPLLAMIQKDTEFTGRNKVIDVIYAGNRARSATYATARANTSSTSAKAFTITRKKNYAYGTIDREAMLAAKKGNTGALIDALATETRSMVSAYKQDMGADVYSDGSGMRARLSSSTTLASTTAVLATASDAVHFEVGDVLNFGPNANGTSLRSGSVTVTGVNRDPATSTLTTSANLSTVTSIANTDYIFKAGDAAAKPTGIGGWIPATAPTAGDSFFGVDRSADPMRLAGLRFDASNYNHHEALIRGLNFAKTYQVTPKDIFMHPEDFGALELILDSKKAYEDVEAAGIGFSALTVNGPAGKCRIFSDGWAPKGTAFALDLEYWTLNSLGDVPDWVTEDGSKLQRLGSAGDGFEFMLAGYYQFGCEAPGQNLRLILPSV